MKYLKLHNTKVSAMGQGTGEGWDNPDKLTKSLFAGIRSGLTLIDTAERYGDGKSEEIIGNILQSKSISRDDIFVCTKFAPEMTTSQGIIKSAEQSLKRLSTTFIDLYQTHWPNPDTPSFEIVKAFEHLVQTGKVKQIGGCNLPLPKLKELIDLSPIPIVSHQIEYSLYDRSQEQSMIPFCEENGITILAYRPLCGGKFKLKPILKNIAELYECSHYQLALHWLHKKQAISIPGSTNSDHVLDNAAALDLKILNEDIAQIDAAYIPVIKKISADQIIINDDVLNGYKTLEEAKENRFELKPGPMDLVKEIESGNSSKPIKVVLTERGYELRQGQMRYWASVIAHGMSYQLCCLIETD